MKGNQSRRGGREEGLTCSASPPHKSQSSPPHSPPPKSPAENKMSYSSPDTQYLPATAPKAAAPMEGPPFPAQSAKLPRSPAPTPAQSETYRDPPYHPTTIDPGPVPGFDPALMAYPIFVFFPVSCVNPAVTP